MVKRTASAKDEPEQQSFELPTEKDHLFQVVDIDEELDSDPDIVFVKCEVVGGEEEGRSLMIRLSLDDKFKGFFATRLFLKSIGCEYKGDNFPIWTDEWPGRQFYATVVHNKGKNDKTYANIAEYNFEKMVDNSNAVIPATPPSTEEEVSWDGD